MMQIGLIGVGAGAAAALLFASVTSGSWLSVILFYLAPLPIMIAGLGWSHWAAMAAAIVAAAAVGIIFGTAFFFAFLAGVGVPAWWLTYLALLARPATASVGGPNEPALEWYPPGRLVVWAAALAALIVLFAIPNFGLDAESFRAGLTNALNRMLQIDVAKDAALPAPNAANTNRLIEFLVTVIPPAAAVLATVTSLVNLWLAGRIVNFSGRLARPWPQLSAMTLPPAAAAALAIATGLSFIDGLLGIVAGVLSASLFMAYGVLGLAVLHDITRGINSRPFLIGGAYASIAVLGWPVLAFSLLGLVETMLSLRARVAKRRGPMTPT
jgi:hypothetical protein